MALSAHRCSFFVVTNSLKPGEISSKASPKLNPRCWLRLKARVYVNINSSNFQKELEKNTATEGFGAFCLCYSCYWYAPCMQLGQCFALLVDLSETHVEQILSLMDHKCCGSLILTLLDLNQSLQPTTIPLLLFFCRHHHRCC